jgi:hypothetical protein
MKKEDVRSKHLLQYMHEQMKKNPDYQVDNERSFDGYKLRYANIYYGVISVTSGRQYSIDIGLDCKQLLKGNEYVDRYVLHMRKPSASVVDKIEYNKIVTVIRKLIKEGYEKLTSTGETALETFYNEHALVLATGNDRLNQIISELESGMATMSKMIVEAKELLK